MHARARDGIHPCRRVRDVRVDDARARGDSHRPIRVDRVEGFPARAPESRSRWIGRRDVAQRWPRIAHRPPRVRRRGIAAREGPWRRTGGGRRTMRARGAVARDDARRHRRRAASIRIDRTHG